MAGSIVILLAGNFDMIDRSILLHISHTRSMHSLLLDGFDRLGLLSLASRNCIDLSEDSIHTLKTDAFGLRQYEDNRY